MVRHPHAVGHMVYVTFCQVNEMKDEMALLRHQNQIMAWSCLAYLRRNTCICYILFTDNMSYSKVMIVVSLYLVEVSAS